MVLRLFVTVGPCVAPRDWREGMASSNSIALWILFCATSQFAIPLDLLDVVLGYGTEYACRIVVPRDGHR